MMRIFLMVVLGALIGCHHRDFNPDLAQPRYPYDLHTTETFQIEVFRDGTEITVVNATAQGWNEPRIWINQQYSRVIPQLAAGQTVTLSLKQFRDDIGETYPAGGFLSARRSMPVRLVELQPDPESPLYGMIAIKQLTGQ